MSTASVDQLPKSAYVPARKATAEFTRPWPLIIAFLAPAVILYLVFFIYPMLQSVKLSQYEGNFVSANSGAAPSTVNKDGSKNQPDQLRYVGAGNYRKLLMNDKMFWTCVWHNVQFVLISGILTLILAMALALSLTRCGRGRDFFRIVFLFPNVMAVVAVAILWSFIFNPSFGVLNAILHSLGLDRFSHAWLGEPATSLPAIMIIQVWMSAGFYMVLFYAGLLRIPADYLEAARIDGASFVQEFRHITLPLLSEILQIAITYIIINSLNVFALVYLINEGRPSRYTNVLLTYLYEQAFTNYNYGYACAIAVMMLVLVLSASFLVNRVFRHKMVEL